jgi:type III secretion protein J
MRSVLASAAVLATACATDIAHDVSEEQANRIVVTLHEHAIGAAKEGLGGTGPDGAGFVVQVAPDDVARALTVLRAADLPRKTEPGLAEVFGEGGLVPTATEERARYAAALSGELSRSLEEIDGVVDARVHIAIPNAQNYALDDEPPRPRGSVLIKHRPGEPPARAKAIQELVAGAVERMRGEDVAVVQVPGRPTPEVKPASLVTIGPVTVTRGSATTLKLVLGVAFGLHIVLALLLVFVLLRRRAADAALPPAAPPPAS